MYFFPAKMKCVATALSASFEPKQKFLWKSLSLSDQALIATPWKQLITFHELSLSAFYYSIIIIGETLQIAGKWPAMD